MLVIQRKKTKTSIQQKKNIKVTAYDSDTPPCMLPFFHYCLLSLSVIPAADASEYTVAPTGAEFTSIQAAINRAFPGDMILVKSGTYRENLLLE